MRRPSRSCRVPKTLLTSVLSIAFLETVPVPVKTAALDIGLHGLRHEPPNRPPGSHSRPDLGRCHVHTARIEDLIGGHPALLVARHPPGKRRGLDVAPR